MLINILFMSWASASLFNSNHENRYCGDNINILGLTINALHEYYRDDTLTPRKLVKCYLKRIRLMNKELGDIIEISRDAKNDAQELSSGLKWVNKPLYGVPIILSGNINTNDSMSTKLDYDIIKDSEKRDAVIVKLFREAGAIILGKARSNIRKFPNPYNLRHNLTGCSAGSAIASNLAMLAVSVEPNFLSLTSASELSLVAMKLTRDDVSVRNILVTEPAVSSIVVLARNVIDCLRLYMILSTRYQKEKKRPTNLFETNTQLDYVLSKQPIRAVGIAKETLFSDLHRTQAPRIRELKHNLIDANIQIVEDLDFSKDMKECLIYYYAYYKSSLVESEKQIRNLLGTLPCTVDDLRIETMSLIKRKIDSSEVDALILPYPFVAFLPRLPVLTIPSGYRADGLPYGITLCTKQQWATILFTISHRIEKENPFFRLRPTFLN